MEKRLYAYHFFLSVKISKPLTNKQNQAIPPSLKVVYYWFIFVLPFLSYFYQFKPLRDILTQIIYTFLLNFFSFINRM